MIITSKEWKDWLDFVYTAMSNSDTWQLYDELVVMVLKMGQGSLQERKESIFTLQNVIQDYNLEEARKFVESGGKLNLERKV